MHFRHNITLDALELFPIATASGISPQMAIGSMPKRPALLVRLRDTDGCFGWGEVWANFPPRANTHKADIIEDVIAPLLPGLSFTVPGELQQLLRDKLSTYFLHVGQVQVFEHILAGLDIALWDLVLRKHNQTVVEFFDLQRNDAPCYASSINSEDLDEYIPLAAERGQRHFKLKIGFQSDAGRSAVEHATSLCPDNSYVVIDSNQSWTLEQATGSLQALEDYSPYFAEEPIAASAPLKHWEQLAKMTSIPLAGGENIYGVENFLEMANSGLSVLQPDVAKWGGVTGALALAGTLPDGVRLWPHFMGTALGQMASLAITAIIGEESVCEMDVNRNPLRTDLCGDVTRIKDGRVHLNTRIGLVPEPTLESLLEFRVERA